MFSLEDPLRAADVFRKDLAAAKVARAELFDDSKGRRPILVHDLRATFVTLSLAARAAVRVGCGPGTTQA